MFLLLATTIVANFLALEKIVLHRLLIGRLNNFLLLSEVIHLEEYYMRTRGEISALTFYHPRNCASVQIPGLSSAKLMRKRSEWHR